MAIGKVNTGGGGSGGTLTVTGIAGHTVTATKDGKTYTRTFNSSGVAVFKGLSTGTWTLTMTGDGQTATRTVDVNADYAVTITYFSATINITYPATSTCVVTNSSGQTVASDTNTDSSTKTWTATVNATGTYTVTATATDGSGKSKSTTVSITADGQSKSVALSFILYLRDGIDDCDADTGGWISEARAWGENVPGAGAPIVDKSNTWIVLTQNYGKGGIYRTVNKIDLSQYNTLVVELAVSATDSHPEYFTFGIWSELGTYYRYNMDAYWNTTDNIGSTVISIDISNLNGSYYVGYGLYNNNLTVASGYVYLK